jgi:hypothetical protein
VDVVPCRRDHAGCGSVVTDMNPHPWMLAIILSLIIWIAIAVVFWP